ncbi:MAG: SDR family oxidoreductase [Myxococcales bacterium]|nr:SDR family oxidoreductase [Myxococcales bacterium]
MPTANSARTDRAPFAGRVVAITGGAGDIGQALGRAFGRAGARIALLDLPGPRLEAAAAGLRALDVDALGLACDVTDPAACQDAVDAARSRLGPVDVLINNAGLSHRSRFTDTDPAVLRRVMEVNFFGAVHCTRAALPDLRTRGGTVVAVSSVAGFAPLVGRTGYAASKHALHGFFDSLRTELADEGVHVLVVCPSFVDTQFARTALNGAGERLQGPRALAGRPLSPDQVADAVVDAVARGKRQRLISPVAHASLWLSRLWPAAYDRVMRRAQREEFA